MRSIYYIMNDDGNIMQEFHNKKEANKTLKQMQTIIPEDMEGYYVCRVME